MIEFFKKILAILKKRSWFDRIMFFIALLFTVAMIIFLCSEIGWYTVFTSVAIGIVYDQIKDFINGCKNIQIEDDRNKK